MLHVNQLIGFGAGDDPIAIKGTQTTQASGSVTSFVVDLPAGVTAGETLIVAIGNTSDRAHEWPVGWTELADDFNGADTSSSIGWKYADGTETTVTVGITGGSECTAVAVRISGRPNATPALSSLATGSSSSPNSGSVASANGLYLAVANGRLDALGTPTINSVPSTYATVASRIYGNQCYTAVASLFSQAATDDPGAWSLSVSHKWMARTIGL